MIPQHSGVLTALRAPVPRTRPTGAGLGLRRAFLADLADHVPDEIDFVEVAPENWLGIGGKSGRMLRSVTERCPLVCHGLSLSLGSPDPLDEDLVRRVRGFLDAHGAVLYTEHLAWCSAGGHLYDLIPLPFTDEAVRHVAGRIRHVQDLLGRRIAVENISYYAAPAAAMAEIDFLCAVLDEADCDLHLDVNNVHVNACNHGYDAADFIRRLPGERIVYGHVAGHWVEDDGLRIDTHGAPVIDPVWGLLDLAYDVHGVFPTLLERDFDIPALPVLLAETQRIAALQARHRSMTSGCRAAG
jgi:hypothetical protein